MKTLSALTFTLLLLAMPVVAADTLPGGQYRCTAEFGAVLLVGSYPIEVNGLPAGTISVKASPTGALAATVVAFGEVEEATGQIRVRANAVRLTLKGKVDEGRIRVMATLQGSAFVGTVTVRGKTGPCRIAVGGIGPILANYDLALSSSGNGRITGNGTLTVGQKMILVTARGGVTRGKVALTIKGEKTFLKTKAGEFTDAGFIAKKWSAQGFGALAKGRGLEIALAN